MQRKPEKHWAVEMELLGVEAVLLPLMGHADVHMVMHRTLCMRVTVLAVTK